jgi:hypothetical protein
MSESSTPFFSSDIAAALDREVSYQPGKADSDFARKYGHLAGAQIRTVGEAFTQFTDMLGSPVNALYKGICTDLVGSLHLIVVNARFNRDPVFSLGLVAALDLVLKNYPEQDTAKKIKTAMLESVGLSEAEIDAEAASLEAWAQGKTKDDISSALKGEGDSPLAQIAKAAKEDQWWMYSRFFGIGLIRIMDIVGVEQDMSVAYDCMEEWVGKCMDKPFYTACVSLSFLMPFLRNFCQGPSSFYISNNFSNTSFGSPFALFVQFFSLIATFTSNKRANLI